MKPLDARVARELLGRRGKSVAPAMLAVAQAIGRGRLAKPKMNKTEATYAALLEDAQRRGEVAWWSFEAVTFKLGDDCRYTPDFAVMRPDGAIELHETKGFMRDDALVKLKVCARMFPFPVYLCRLLDGAWMVEVVKP